MWTAPFLSLPKFLFFANRYAVETLLVFDAIASSRNHLSHGFCVFYLRWLALVTTIINVVVEGILYIRVAAVYRSNKLALGVALFFYLSAVIICISLTVVDYAVEGVAVDDFFSILPGCYADGVPAMIAGYYIALPIVEAVLFGLIIFRAVTWWRDKRAVPPTMVVLARDSTTYFAIVFASILSNLFVFKFAPPFLAPLMVPPSNIAGCIMGSRMLLNIRGLGTVPNSTDVEMISGLNFARFGGTTQGTTTLIPVDTKRKV